MNRRLTIIIALLIIAVSLAVALGRNTTRIVLLDKAGNRLPLRVEVADTPTTRQQGLMQRESLGQYDGMIFVSPEPEEQSFWMKNTLIPLDIIFFDPTGGFVSSAAMIPCLQDPCPTYKSQALAKYALEAPAGFIKQYGVRVGWQLEWRGKINPVSK